MRTKVLIKEQKTYLLSEVEDLVKHFFEEMNIYEKLKSVSVYMHSDTMSETDTDNLKDAIEE